MNEFASLSHNLKDHWQDHKAVEVYDLDLPRLWVAHTLYSLRHGDGFLLVRSGVIMPKRKIST